MTPPHPFQRKLLLACSWLLLTSFNQCFVTTMDNTHGKRSRVSPEGPETAEKSLLAALFQADQGQRICRQCLQGGCQVLQLFRTPLCTAPSKLLYSPVLAPILYAQAKAARKGVFHIEKMPNSWGYVSVDHLGITDLHQVFVDLTFVCQGQCAVEVLLLHGPCCVIDLVRHPAGPNAAHLDGCGEKART